ncbi:MAG: 2,4-dienoyl-CoA reductase-like NADH-dependent reductase (Old Yellow Enzyme family) [Halieaceae bacterium]|jgi:2,4-dienoyl-CoA reductase-like NADH-dependent reductase (Old Yellow Enzyme family)
MWKPAERIKYVAVEDHWPSRDELDASLLFSPLSVGPMPLLQRTWVPAMVPWRSNEEGEVTEDVLNWYARFARGKPGAIVVEATGIRDTPSGPLLRIGDDRFIPGLKKLVDVVREASDGETRLLIQLIDFLPIRRRPDPQKYIQYYLAISNGLRQRLEMNNADDEEVRRALLEMDHCELINFLSPKEWEDMQLGYRERVTDTHLEHIADLPQTLPKLFTQAACRAQEAGFDGVELHYAHAYTMASFLSATNNRGDGYGGARENRVRLPLEVFRAVRNACGDDFVIGCRFLSDEIIDGGSGIDDACYFASTFAEEGMDFLSLSRGGKFDDAKQPKVGWSSYPYTGRSGYECMPGYISDEQGPFGRNIQPVASIRTALRDNNLATPVIVAGGFYSFAQAEGCLQNAEADIIGFARQALADPDWFIKVKSGYGAQVMLCKYSNYCEGLDQKHKQVTCELWDRKGLDEPGVDKSSDGRRRLLAPPWEPSD